ncbi:MAG: GtrA family protein [Clostridia bacterium]|nr:GtrA family protein [Clostridia bacterium]
MMVEKLKALWAKHREVLMYLIFGVMTTFVGWGVYYAVLLSGRAIFDIPAEETASVRYFALYTAAQIIQWVCAVLFAFFTNRAWVFTDADKSTSWWKQLLPFAGGRVVTLGLDFVITLGLTLGLGALIPAWTAAELFGKTWNLCEIFSKVVAAVVVIVANYVISKLFVFKNKKEQ